MYTEGQQGNSAHHSTLPRFLQIPVQILSPLADNNTMSNSNSSKFVVRFGEFGHGVIEPDATFDDYQQAYQWARKIVEDLSDSGWVLGQPEGIIVASWECEHEYVEIAKISA